MSQSANLGQLFTAVDALADFDFGRVTQGDLTVMQDAGWTTNRKAAAVIWRGPGVYRRMEITGDDTLALSFTNYVQFGMPYDATLPLSATWPTRWRTLQNKVIAALRTWAGTVQSSYFEMELRWGDEPPTYSRANPAPNGATMWVSFTATEYSPTAEGA